MVLTARAANLALVRQALVGLGDAYGLEERMISDMKTAVTEACTNAVLHAYDDEGPVELDAWPSGERVVIAVRDFGSGMRPHPAVGDGEALGLGIPLISALSDAFEIRGHSGGGTEVRMAFGYEDETSAAEEAIAALGTDNGEPAHMSPDTLLAVADGPLVPPILSRVIAMAGARADLSLDRVSDAQILGDAIASSAADDSLNSFIRVELEDGDDGLCIRVGPLVAGGAERLREKMNLPNLGRSLEQLADEVAIEPASNGGGKNLEYLSLRLSPRTAA